MKTTQLLLLLSSLAALAALVDPDRVVEVVKEARAPPRALWQVYSSCSAEIENDGHRFGEDLSDADKNALIAFLATL